MGTYYYTRFAQTTYGQGTYNSCTYGDTTSCTSTGGNAGSGSGASGASLTNTGLMIALVVAVASLIVFVALIVRFWRRPKRELAVEPVQNNDEVDEESQPPEQQQ